MKCIVGLGNPGSEYAHTRHNIGFDLLDHYAHLHKTTIAKKKFKALFGEATIAGKKVLLLKPQSFMNLSGESLFAVKNFYKLSILDFLVIHDDMDIPLGEIKFREKGSSGGHNGLNSIITLLGTTEFARLKIGIGRPIDKLEVTGYVLGRFSAEERKKVEAIFPAGIEKIEKWLK
jgi:PTH1 family peptidyl-tRNA hydrolase